MITAPANIQWIKIVPAMKFPRSKRSPECSPYLLVASPKKSDDGRFHYVYHLARYNHTEKRWLHRGYGSGRQLEPTHFAFINPPVEGE